MYQTRDLAAVQKTLKQLGDPIKVNQNNTGLRATQPGLNYAMRVRFNLARDTLVGKVISLDGVGYSAQAKLSKNNTGGYVLSYVGINSLYQNSMVSDPETDGWVDGSSIGTYMAKDKYYKVNLNSASGFYYINKNLGFSNIFTEGNDFVVRFIFSLPSVGGEPKSILGLGTHGGTTVPAWNTMCRIIFPYVDTTSYSVAVKRGITTLNTGLILNSDTAYILDIIHSASTNEIFARIWGPEGYIGSIREYNLWVSPFEADKLLITNEGSISGTIDSYAKIYGVQVWFNSMIVKRSFDNCKTWERLPTNPRAVGTIILDCSSAINHTNNYVYTVWTEKTGTPAGYAHVWYSYFNNSVWSSPSQVSGTSSNYDRLNPNIILKEDDDFLYACMCWRKNIDLPGESDIFYHEERYSK